MASNLGTCGLRNGACRAFFSSTTYPKHALAACRPRLPRGKGKTNLKQGSLGLANERDRARPTET